MTVYNMTAKVSKDLSDEWLAWQLEEHVPEIMQTGLFDDYRLYRLTAPVDADGVTFVIQFFADVPAKCNEYATSFAYQMETKAMARWNGDFVFFCSIMEAVN
jgi:hypothetical protein